MKNPTFLLSKSRKESSVLFFNHLNRKAYRFCGESTSMMTVGISSIFRIILFIIIMNSSQERNSAHDNSSNTTISALRNFRITTTTAATTTTITTTTTTTTITTTIDPDFSGKTVSGTTSHDDKMNGDNENEELGSSEKRSITEKGMNVTSRENLKSDRNLTDRRTSSDTDHETTSVLSSEKATLIEVNRTQGPLSQSSGTEKNIHISTDHSSTDHTNSTQNDSMIVIRISRKEKRLTTIYLPGNSSLSEKKSETHKKIPDDHEKSGKNEKKSTAYPYPDHHFSLVPTEKLTTPETSEKTHSTTYETTKKGINYSSVEYNSITSSSIVENTFRTTSKPVKIVLHTVKKLITPDYGANITTISKISDRTSPTINALASTSVFEEKFQEKVSEEVDSQKSKVSQENHTIGPFNLSIDSEKKVSNNIDQSTPYKTTTERESFFLHDFIKNTDKKSTNLPLSDQNVTNTNSVTGTLEKDDGKASSDSSSADGKRTSNLLNVTFIPLYPTIIPKRFDSEMRSRTEKNTNTSDTTSSTEKSSSTSDSSPNFLSRSESNVPPSTTTYSKN